MLIKPNGKVDVARFAGVVMMLGGLMALLLAGLGVTSAGATQPNPEHKVTLCHRTASYSNPYVVITVDVASVLHQHGHDGHNGPVFFAGIPKHNKWGDIIPPFDFGPGRQYAGKNWTADGRAILNAGCVVPSATTTTTEATTTSEATSTSGETTSTGETSTTSAATVTAGGNTTSPRTNVEATTLSIGPTHGILPRTGSSTFALVAVALVLIGSGLGLARRGRRLTN